MVENTDNLFTFTYHIVNIKHTNLAYNKEWTNTFTYHIVNIKLKI